MSILIVDDQEFCVSVLINRLRAVVDGRISIDYLSSSQEVIEAMQEYLETTGQPYQALITDFNMDALDGLQLLQVMTGRVEGWNTDRDSAALQSFADITDEELREYVQANFVSLRQYQDFCARHAALTKILFSSEHFGNRLNALPADITFVPKVERAECQVAQILRSEGVLSDQEYKRACRLQR